MGWIAEDVGPTIGGWIKMGNRLAGLMGVVDDDASLRRSLRNLLTSVGFPVETFASAEELLQSGHLAAMRGLVLDLKLEGMSGLDLLAHLQGIGAAVRVVMLTAHADAHAERRAFELGAMAFLTKPFEPDPLLQAVRAAVARDDDDDDDDGSSDDQ